MASTLATVKRRVLGNVGRSGAYQITDEELYQAICDAIEDGSHEMPYDVAPDETNVTLAADTYEYSLASVGMDLIHRVTMADADGDFPYSNIIPGHLWGILQGTTPKLHFDEVTWTPTADRKLRIEGQKYQTAPGDEDSSAIYVDVAFTVARAAATLLGNLGSPREATMAMRAEDARQRHDNRPHPGARKVYL